MWASLNVFLRSHLVICMHYVVLWWRDIDQLTRKIITMFVRAGPRRTRWVHRARHDGSSSVALSACVPSLLDLAHGAWGSRLVMELIRNCEVCQQNKTEHLRPGGLLQPLKIPSVLGGYCHGFRESAVGPCNWGTHSYCGKTRVVIRNYALSS